MSEDRISSSFAAVSSSAMGKCIDRLRSVKNLVFNRNQSIKLTLQDTSVTLSNVPSATRTIEALNDDTTDQSLSYQSQPFNKSQHEPETTTEEEYPSKSTTDIDSLDDLINLIEADTANRHRIHGRHFDSSYNRMRECNSDSGFASEEVALPVASTSIGSSIDQVQSLNCNRRLNGLSNNAMPMRKLQDVFSIERSRKSSTDEIDNHDTAHENWTPFGVDWEWKDLPDGGCFRNGNVLLTIEEVEEGELIGAIGKEITPGIFEELSVGELAAEQNYLTAKNNLRKSSSVDVHTLKSKREVKRFYDQINDDDISSLTTIDSDFVEQCLMNNNRNKSSSCSISKALEARDGCGCSERTSVSCSWSDESSYFDDNDNFSTSSSLGIYEQIPVLSDELLDRIVIIP